MRYWNDCPTRIEENVSLAELTTWGIGGPAQFFARPATLVELGALLSEARIRQMPVHILGGGSNVLVSDDGVSGLVFQLARKSEFDAVHVDKVAKTIHAGAATPLGKLLHIAAEAGLCGLEGLAGIPGTLGGALRMNAGTPQCEIGASVHEVEVLNANGSVETWSHTRAAFAYRSSVLCDVVVLRALLKLTPDDPEAIAERIQAAAHAKKETQPLGMRTCGCVFRNPPNDAAGRLIDAAGLKGAREGDAAVSTLHANFILNMGAASCADVERLIERVRDVVLRQHGVELHEEVERWL